VTPSAKSGLMKRAKMGFTDRKWFAMQQMESKDIFSTKLNQSTNQPTNRLSHEIMNIWPWNPQPTFMIGASDITQELERSQSMKEAQTRNP
jgi:hypothetical protein